MPQYALDLKAPGRPKITYKVDERSPSAAMHAALNIHLGHVVVAMRKISPLTDATIYHYDDMPEPSCWPPSQ